MPKTPPPSAEAHGERLNRALALAGVASRRKADELIFAGRVTVNGAVVIEPGRRVDPARDKITVDGRPVGRAAAAQTYVMLHKPVEVVTSASDPQGRRTVLDLLPEPHRGRRLVPVGRLDYFSEGLLILTDDGELTYRLTHPRWHVEKEYEVWVRGEVSEEALTLMRRGMRLAEGEELAPVQVRIAGHRPGGLKLSMILGQGVNRQIRRMCRDLGLTILSLTRVRQGPLRLGELPRGQARELTPAEVAALKTAVDL
jgi:23S rRNA pseudouridine2605 synthase